jgi:hypothetical protein
MLTQWHMVMHSKMTMLLPCWTHVRVLALHSSERMPTPDLGVRYCALTEQSKPHWSWANFAFTGGRQALRAFKQIDGEDQPESSCETATTNQENPLCYWVVHGTSLIRAAPEHVRPSVEDDGRDLTDNVAAAHEAVQGIRGRSTTQYADLRGTAGPTIDMDSDEDMGVGDDRQSSPATAPPAPPPATSPGSTPPTPRTPQQRGQREDITQPEDEMTPSSRPNRQESPSPADAPSSAPGQGPAGGLPPEDLPPSQRTRSTRPKTILQSQVVSCLQWSRQEAP